MSKTINVIATAKAKEGNEDQLRALIESLVGPTTAEAGCISFRPLPDPSAPGSWVIVEEWADQAAVDAHMTSPHFAAVGAALPDLVSEPAVIKFLTELN